MAKAKTPECPTCKTPMEDVGEVHRESCESGCCNYSTTLYQCATCKRVTIA